MNKQEEKLEKLIDTSIENIVKEIKDEHFSLMDEASTSIVLKMCAELMVYRTEKLKSNIDNGHINKEEAESVFHETTSANLLPILLMNGIDLGEYEFVPFFEFLSKRLGDLAVLMIDNKMV